MVEVAILCDDAYPVYSVDHDSNYFREITGVSIGVMSREDFEFVTNAIAVYTKAQTILADMYQKYRLSK